MKVPALVAVPPGVVTPIVPVFALAGTVAVICVLEFTANLAALTPPKVTLVAPVRLWPVMTTAVPAGPLGGEKLKITGVTRKARLLESVPPGVVTWTWPVVAASGTIVEIWEAETTVNRAAVPLKLTLLAPVRFVPRF